MPEIFWYTGDLESSSTAASHSQFAFHTIPGTSSGLRSILEEKENFFSRWNVCLIQCDSFVQDVTMIHSPKEWEAYRETITIKGRGGTDFRPVFQKVEELRKQHVFRNLKALIYFTDGDGIYPEQKPDYETAFVFVRQTEKMNLVPKWAKKLLTEECTL